MQLFNPYKSADGARMHRISIDVPHYVAIEIKKVLPEHGSINRMLTMIVHHIYEFSTRNDLAYARDGHHRLTDHICELCDSAGRPTIESTRQGPERDDGRRAEELRRGHPSTTNESATD